MTLSTTAARVQYNGPGAGPFTIPFRFTVSSDLQVIKRSSTGVETALSLTTHYTVSGTGNATASLTLVSALVSGETLSIVRTPTIDQQTSLANQTAYYGSTHEAEFDRLVMQLQLLKDQIDRSFKVQDSYDPSGIVSKVIPETGKVLAWLSATQLGNVPLDSSAVALPGASRTVSTLTAYLLNNAVYNAKDYGCKGDGATDDKTAAQLALNSIPAGATLLFPAGTYKFGSALTNTKAKVTICGEGDATVFNAQFGAGPAGDPLIISSGYDDVIVRDLKISGQHGGGVYLTGGNRCRLLRLNISGATLTNSKSICAGIYVEQVDDIVIDLCRLSDNGSATGEGHGDIVCNTGTYQITNSQVTNNKCSSTLVNANICIFDPRGVRVAGNECTGAIVSPISATRQGYGILLYHTVTVVGSLVGECKVTDNDVHNVGGAGIFMQDIRDSDVSRNKVRDYGATQTDGTLSVAGIVIEGYGYTCHFNRVYNAVGIIKDGISVSSCTKSSVVGNVVSDIGQNGIGIRGVCSDVVIGKNQVSNVTRSGVGMWSDTAAVRIKVANNSIRTLNGTAVGVWATAATSDWSISDNDVSDIAVGATGFSVSGATHSFDRNKQEGKYCREGWGANIGDASVALNNLDKEVVYFNTQLTGNRTVTLPPIASGTARALRQHRHVIVRDAATPGAFTIAINLHANDGGATVCTLLANVRASVTVERNDITGSDTFKQKAYGVLL
jgi:hypothetical protein